MMLKLTPLYADRSFRAFSERGDYGGHSAGYETFYNHARLQQMVIQPQPGVAGLEKGAWFARVPSGDVIARRELCVEVEHPHQDGGDEPGHEDEPVLVPRVKIGSVPGQLTPGVMATTISLLKSPSRSAMTGSS